MRKPKHRKVNRGSDEHTADYSAHAPSDAFVRVSVCETENAGPYAPAGTLFVDLERVEGPVIVRWTDASGTVHAYNTATGERLK